MISATGCPPRWTWLARRYISRLAPSHSAKSSRGDGGSAQSRDHAYCVDLVKRRDFEGYLCSLLLPGLARRSAFAIRALNVEVATVRDAVSERSLGQMRLKFWSDAVEAVFEEARPPPEHPVAKELRLALERHSGGLSKTLLLRLIESRFTVMTDRPFDSLDEVDRYSHEAFSSLNYLLLECLNDDTAGDNDQSNLGHARHAANQLGMAQGLVTLLRAVPVNASRRRVLLPSDLMLEHGVTSDTVIRRAAGSRRAQEVDVEALKLVVEATAARAQEHLDNSRFRSKYLSREQRLVMLPAVAVDAHLGALHKAECDVFQPAFQQRNSWLPMSLYYHKWKRSY